MADLKRTGLFDLHGSLGGKMVPFAGYEMPVQYGSGVLKEHLHCREAAALFDVGHMGQIILRPKSGKIEDACLALEKLVPADILSLAEGRQRYAMFTNADGGILDDLMVAHRRDHLFLVVNASMKDADLSLLKDGLGDICTVEMIEDRGLIALQGPWAEAGLDSVVRGPASMRFMDVGVFAHAGSDIWVSRSGYSGEDGFEISVPNELISDFVERLLHHADVEMAGLGARDSLRLEAGLCLYGSDIDPTTSPIEASLTWAIQKSRRPGGDRAGGFPGYDRVSNELESGPPRKRVGLLPNGRAPMRAGTEIFTSDTDTIPIGKVTSGAFGPSIERPMSMGYVATEHSDLNTVLWGDVRGKRLPVTVSKLPFRSTNYRT
jgi:aminomethyltransferase